MKLKRMITILCVLAIIMAGSAAALDTEDTGQSASYYPISVEEYAYGDFNEPRINKVYQLSLSDDPSLNLNCIPSQGQDKGVT